MMPSTQVQTELPPPSPRASDPIATTITPPTSSMIPKMSASTVIVALGQISAIRPATTSIPPRTKRCRLL